MYSLRDADVVIALGTRLSPFGTLPQYGENYYPTGAKVIQVRTTTPPELKLFRCLSLSALFYLKSRKSVVVNILIGKMLLV